MIALSVRAALFLTGFLGVLWSILGLFTRMQDVGAGMVVTSASIIGWGCMDYIEARR